MVVSADENYVLTFQERVQQLERQLREMEREKERELNALRKEKRELVHSQTVRKIYDTIILLLKWDLLYSFPSLYCQSGKPLESFCMIYSPNNF